MARLLLFTAVASFALTPLSVSAQSDEDRARQLVEEAQQAAQHGQLAIARDLLAEALELAPRPSIAFGLADVHRASGDPRSAELLLNRLIDGGYGEASDERAEAARTLLRQVVAEMATLRVTAHGSDEITVRIDGERAGTLGDGRPDSFRINPGRHVVSVSAPDGRSEEATVDVEQGDARGVDLELPPEADEGGISPWVWIIGETLLAGLAVTGVVLLTMPGEADPIVSDDFNRVIDVLRGP